MRRLLAAFVFCLCACSSVYAGPGLKVTASLWVLGHIAEEIGGGRIEVVHVVPPGAEPHEYEPTPKDMASVYGSGLFIFQDSEMEPWAGRIRDELVAKGIVVLEMMPLLGPYLGDGPSALRRAHGMQIWTGEGKRDPHAWLDPEIAALMTEALRDALVKADPAGREHYEAGASEYIRELMALDKRFREGLSDCRIRDIVVMHDAFSYLARRYGFRAHAASGLSPQEEPSPRRLGELVDLIRERGIRYVFVEPLVNPRIARTLASETGAEVLGLSPIGGFEEEYMKRGPTYIAEMGENLKSLRLAMGCR